MSSPFPGMDPFLENPIHFPGLHDALIAQIQMALQPRLPEPYYAAIGDRVWLEVSHRLVGPDANVLRANGGTSSNRQSSAAIAVAPKTRTEPLIIFVPKDEIRETFIEIFARLENELLVTTLEVLSLANKTPGEQGRDLYLRKQSQILTSKVHLVEIDLLRGGQHTTAVPKDRLLAQVQQYDYHVSVRRFDDVERYSVYPVRLMQPLPEILVPLLPGDPPVALDLQAAFDQAYDFGPFRRRVHYGRITPTPPLRPEQAEWVATVMKEKGLTETPPG